MDNVFKKLKLLFSFTYCCTSFPCFSAYINSNFVLVSSSARTPFVEYVAPKNHIQIERVEAQQKLHKFDAKCQGVFSFYPSPNSETPKIVTKKGNMVFLFTGENKLEPLGPLLSFENKVLLRMENSVEQGKLLVGFINKLHRPVALVQDNKGAIYSVTRMSKKHYSIQSLGILASVLQKW